jgi:uncharacterized protein
MQHSFLGRGWSFPIKPTAGGRLNYIADEEKVRQSIQLILSTAPGERQMLPEFGCDLHRLVFEANSAQVRSLVRVAVRDALQRWEPRIEVVDVRVVAAPWDRPAADNAPEGADWRNYLLIRIDYRIHHSNTLYNLVYPFYLTEGVA